MDRKVLVEVISVPKYGWSSSPPALRLRAGGRHADLPEHSSALVLGLLSDAVGPVGRLLERSVGRAGRELLIHLTPDGVASASGVAATAWPPGARHTDGRIVSRSGEASRSAASASAIAHLCHWHITLAVDLLVERQDRGRRVSGKLGSRP